MSWRHILNVVGLLLLFLSLAMLGSGGVAWAMSSPDARWFFLSSGITVAAGSALYALTAPLEGDISLREGFAIVTFSWVAVGVFGALPFWFGGVSGSLPRAIFESFSGFTTTGATVFSDIEALPAGILLWRSMSHWIGGMGIIVLAIAILPYLGVGGMQLFRAEVPGPTPERLRPRITQTAKLLWYVYLGMTAAQAALYLLGGMSLFDAVNHAFSTLSTGGFSTRNASVAAFDSRFIQWVTILFMYLAGVNFTLHFRAASGRPVYWKDSEWRFFSGVIALAGLSVAIVNLASGGWGEGGGAGVERAIREAFFSVLSVATTTGFANSDWELWAPAAQGILLLLLFLGGMAGSTAGGVKAIRVLLLVKHTANELRKQLHPRAILLVRAGRHVVREEVMATILGFVILYVLLIGVGMSALTLFGNDLLTSFSASAASVGNIGPGFGGVGPTDNYGWMSDPELLVLTFLMLVGRLEIFTVLLLFLPEFWRRPGGRVVTPAETRAH